MKKILFIIYTHSLGGGAEKILTTIVNNLNPEKYQIDIQEYAHFQVKDEPVRPEIHYLPPIVSMADENRWIRLLKNIQVFSIPYFLKRRQTQYDLEISFNYLIPTFLLSGKVPAISWFHGDIYDLEHRPYFRALERKALQKVSNIVTISSNTFDSVKKVYPEYIDKTLLIHNGFDTVAIREAGNIPCDIRLQPPAIAAVGRLDDNKRPLFLLEVVKTLKEQGKLVNLYYIGQGELKQALEEKIHEYELEDQVFLLGYQQNPYPLMAQCHAICVASKSEGFPTVLAEGMALGVPFVSTHVGGTDELSSQKQCGILADTVEEYAAAIARVVLNDTTHAKMRDACLTHIEEFSLPVQIQKIEDLIDSVIG